MNPDTDVRVATAPRRAARDIIEAVPRTCGTTWNR